MSLWHTGYGLNCTDRYVPFVHLVFLKVEIYEMSLPVNRKRLTLVTTRVLQMSDDVLCVKVSADNRLLAVSLLDNTIKVFFCDTLKVVQ